MLYNDIVICHYNECWKFTVGWNSGAVKSYNKQILVFLKNSGFTRMSTTNINTSGARNASVRELNFVFFFHKVRKYIKNGDVMAV